MYKDTCKKTNENILVSVIIPVYNVEKYLDKCIKSIVSQTYQNLEIILVNDGSSDGCPDLCDIWAKKDNRIKVIHKTNGGLSSARNAGLDVATGEYICFVDSDDYICSDYAETLYKSICENNADIAICEYTEVNKEGNILQDRFHKKRLIDGIITRDQVFEKLLNGYVPIVVAWNKIYKKSIFSQLRFKEGKKHEDEFTIHHVIIKANTVNCISKPLYNYFIRSNSIMGEGFNIQSIDYLDALQDRVDLLEKYENEYLYHKAILQLLNESARFYKDVKKTNKLTKSEIKLIFEKIKRNYKKYSKLILFSKHIGIDYKYKVVRYLIKVILLQILYK